MDAACSPTDGSVRSVLSYFRSYFDPDTRARFANHSTGLIAQRLHQVLSALGPVDYYGSKARPIGRDADLFIGHFWAFAELCENNEFGSQFAFYSVSDPVATRRFLSSAAERFAVPMPEWDLPPSSFDHARTMELADTVFVVGNSYTLHTFPEKWWPKIVLLNYSIDRAIFRPDPPVAPERDFCYVATHCGLRKGFVDVVNTWSGLDRRLAQLHVIGNLSPPFDQLLAQSNNGNIRYHGWIDSDMRQYREIIGRCRFAFVPTYSEGQMGTLLELIHSGCVPITTAASGVDDEVLAHCIVVEPLDVEGQRRAVEQALSWDDDEYEQRRFALLDATRRRQTWESFDAGVRGAILERLGVSSTQ